MCANIEHRHPRPQKPRNKRSLGSFESIVNQLAIQRAPLRQPPGTEGQPQGQRHRPHYTPYPIRQRDVPHPRRLRQESPHSRHQRLRLSAEFRPRVPTSPWFGHAFQASQRHRPMRRKQNRPTPRMVARLAKIVMFRQARHAIHMLKSRSIEHFYQTRFARIKRHIRQTLIILEGFAAQHHARFVARHAHALDQQSLAGKRTQVPNRPHRTLEVIQQPETQHQIECAQRRNFRAFNVSAFEPNLRKSLPRLDHIFESPIEPTRLQPKLRERLREKSDTTTRVERVVQCQNRF